MSVINSKFRIHGWGENRGGREGGRDVNQNFFNIVFLFTCSNHASWIYFIKSGAYKTGKFVSNSF